MTTVVALMPMAMGLVGSSKSYGPFAASIAFGLLFAMFGTLFVVPLSYSTLSSLDDRRRRVWNRLRGRDEDSDGNAERIESATNPI